MSRALRNAQHRFWIINIHTRACFGPYDTANEGQEDITNDPQPQDWVLVKPVPQRRKK